MYRLHGITWRSGAPLKKKKKKSIFTHSLQFDRLQCSDNLPCSAIHLHKYSSVLHFDASLCGFAADTCHKRRFPHQSPCANCLEKKKIKKKEICLALIATLLLLSVLRRSNAEPEKCHIYFYTLSEYCNIFSAPAPQHQRL